MIIDIMWSYGNIKLLIIIIILNYIAGKVINTPIIAIIIAKDVNIPNNIVGTKFDKHRTEKPNAIVSDVVKTALPTVLCAFSIVLFLLLLKLFFSFIL